MKKLICIIVLLTFTNLAYADFGADKEMSAKTLACFKQIVKDPLRTKGKKLKDLISYMLSLCAAKSGTLELLRQSDAFPFTVAIDQDNGKEIEVDYFCTDVCPTAATVLIKYKNVKKNECCDIGGVQRYSHAWGKFYIGCIPKELATDYQKQDSECD